ncbi:carcinoembryonic antigen-related cell adhesion molecule 1-like [Labeo rohita]|uniref:carcinoembryonic antigen-related cell adhesion molecule 1-like n=1 Tax=Labeo rohita TaxID=84645 RepID=UPI0021E29AA7|nr:carcinoembryonic antigen-related cell adhesion molecule 1-like [Labeo rohita]
MKSTLQIVLFLLMMCGVFYAETDEPISVMEGDSVTLNLDLTKIQRLYLIQWRFGDKGSTIAQTDGNEISDEDYEIFRDRLQLNQTGSLTITNIRTNHSGLYEAEIGHSTGTSYIKFNVYVYEPHSVIAGAESEMKSVSVMEGDPVTLHVPQLQGNELIVWGFGDEGKLIAKHDMEAKTIMLYNTDERFRDRLKLDRQTGSLIITNSRTTDSGPYSVKISSNKQTSYKRFTVTVSGPGLSPGAVAGIVVVVVLLVAASAAVGVFFYRRKCFSGDKVFFKYFR